jgi:hypothetical protein
MHESAGRSDLDGPREPVENVTIGVPLSRRRNFPSAAVLEIFSDSLYPIGEAFNFRRSFSGKRICRSVGAAGAF